MNNDSMKIKYLIGSFRDSPDYPTNEDFFFLISSWYYNEGGSSFVHEQRGVENKGSVVFPDNILLEKLQKNEKMHKKLVKRLISDGVIAVFKETRFTTYYEILKGF
jgi:hypothetical protein